MNRFFVAIVVVVGLAGGCGRPGVGVYQNSTIDALLDGNYEGEITVGQLKERGDLGLGTFDALDGEMIVVDGVCYQVRADGVASVPSDATRTPLGIVTRFRPDVVAELLAPAGYKNLQDQLDALRPNDGRAYAFRIEGTFSAMRTRSVPRQSRPYARLAEVVKTQPTFDFENVSGTLVGFWFPESMRHVNVPGYHFHFLTHDRTRGGHVLGLTLSGGRVWLQQMDHVVIALPESPPATQPTSGGARHDELNAVEK